MTLRVLVVEDDREIRVMMQSSLAVEGFAVQTAVSLSGSTFGFEAIVAFRPKLGGYPSDC